MIENGATDRRQAMNFAREIETLIRARYPLLYIVSAEEARMQELLVDIAQRRQKRVFEWSVSTGVVPAGTSIQSQKHRNAPTRDPLLALNQVKIELDDAGRERLLQAALGLTLGEAENVSAKLIMKDGRLSGEDVNEVLAEKQQIIRKSGLLEYYATNETFSHVGGLAVLKEWLQKRAVAFSAEAHAFGLPAPKGILMLGVQGCGKSLCAKAVASHWQFPLLRFDMGRMFASLVGSSEENIRRAIAVADSV